ncbi:HNH endonuclease [Nonomuraea typhae]|uniref:HNH endonuclease n=1 Tax=Nonomuraea typhae TaxID=2603600 RepID=A0ABW7YKP5_9ACTN
MSIVLGKNDYLNTSVIDEHLKTAVKKLDKQIAEIRENGCKIVPPVGPTKVAPRFMVNGDYDLSRRWSWRLHHGPIPEGHRIYTSCHDRYCVAPEHLFAYRAERKPKGERKIVRPLAKLDWTKVAEIRASEDDYATLATRYGVHPTTIRSIRDGKTWVKH